MKAAGPSACALAACLLWPVSIAVGVATAGPDSALRLQSDYLPFPIHFDGDQSNREMRSIRIVGKLPPAGDGEIWLDTRAAEINSFGDVVQRVGPEPTPVRVELRYISKVADQTTNQGIAQRESQASAGFRLYDLVFPGGVPSVRLKLVLGTEALLPHRLLACGTWHDYATSFFDGTEFHTRSLASLNDLSQMESLTFYNCRGITDEGVSHLVGLTGLKMLSFYSEQLHRPPAAQWRITDAGVAHLKRLVRLEDMNLFGHDLSDASVGILSAMTELRKLALSGHGLTDAGLEGLSRLSKLRELRLFETAVTTNGVARVKARLPQLQIEAWSRGGHD